MIPSRGLRWSSQTIGIGRRRLEPLSTRHFSSVVQYTHFRSNPLLSQNSTAVSRTNTKFQLSRSNNIIRNGVGVRFASSAPAVLTTPVSTTDTPSGAAASSASSSPEPFSSSLDNVTDIDVHSLAELPETIGYLKSLGLDYGFGPTAGMEWILEHIHVFAGTPWWVSIALTAVLVRVVLFKGYMMASDNAGKMALVRPLTLPLTKEMTRAQMQGNTDRVLELRRELQLMNARAGVVMWKSFIPILQVFTGYGTYRVLRGMSLLPVPGLENGGMLWFSNLTVADPYFIIPAMTSLAMWWVLKKGGETGASAMSPQATKLLMIAFPALSFVFTFWLPASVQVSFLATGLLSLAQAALFRNAKFRERFDMQPLGVALPGSKPSSPYKGTINIRARPAPLTQAEINKTYAEPSADLKAGKRSLADGLIGGALNDIKGTFKSIKESVSDTTKMATDKLDERKKKAERKAVYRYEYKRAAQLREERHLLEEQRRIERQQRNKGKK